MPVSFQLPVTIILLGGGLLACFLGYRLFRFVLAVYGLVAGAIVAVQVVGAQDTWVTIVTVVVGALVGAILFVAVYFIGVAIVGAGLAAVAINLFWAQRPDEPHVLVVILAAIVGAFVALVFQRYVIIVGTSFAGAWTGLIAALALMGDVEAAEAIGSFEAWATYPIERASAEREVLIAWVGFGLIGVVVQLFRTGKGRKKRRK